jgi:hypothetical protein
MEVEMADISTPRLVRVGRIDSTTKSDSILPPLEPGSPFLGRVG